MRIAAPLMVGAVIVTAVAGCSEESGSEATQTEIVYVTSTPSSSAASSEVSASHSSSPAAGKAPTALAKSFADLSAQLGQPVSLAMAPVGGGDVVALGELAPQVAWSTIKVPLALAAQRNNGGLLPTEQPAIVDSDNAAAESLWASLGSSAQAAQAVTAVLREGGDDNSQVPAEKRRDEFTIFGQTVWADTDAATFTAHLPCLPGAEDVVEMMGQVSANQQWGIEVIPDRDTAVKGGWGPSDSGGYVVRQIGLLTKKNGAQTAFALTTHAPGASMDSGIVALNQVGTWLGRHLAALPGGHC